MSGVVRGRSAGETAPGASRPATAPGRREHYLWTRSMTDRSVTAEPDLATVVDLLDDEHVRSILAATSAEPLSATELSERCDVSPSSIYRRVERLTEADLLDDRTRPRSDGHHETVYVAALDRFELRVREGELDWTVERRGRDVADELSRMWGEL